MSTTTVTITTDLAMPAPVGQRLGCDHLIATGKPVYLWGRTTVCSTVCRDRLRSKWQAARAASERRMYGR